MLCHSQMHVTRELLALFEVEHLQALSDLYKQNIL